MRFMRIHYVDGVKAYSPLDPDDFENFIRVFQAYSQECTIADDDLRTISSHRSLTFAQLRDRLPPEFDFSEDLYGGRTYDEVVKIQELDDNFAIEFHNFTTSSLSDDEEDLPADYVELPYEEVEEIFRDTDIQIEAADPAQPHSDQYRVTFLPERISFTIDLSSDEPSIHSSSYPRRILRPGTSLSDYMDIALDRTEAY